MATPLDVSTRRDGGEVTLTVVGEIDMSNVDVLEEALTAAGRDAGALTLDFSGVEYLDSRAINLLFTHADHIAALAVNPILVPVLKISGLADVLSIRTGD
jgi:anti-anti-sigma factor